MKDHLKGILAGRPDPNTARCLVREYLQARILQTLQDRGVFRAWAFQGGTALRLLHQLPRFSEDLDFALAAPGSPHDFRGCLQAVERVFKAEGYEIRITVNDRKTVHSAFANFAGLLSELRLSPHRSEALSVRLELDTNPPAGAGLATSIVRRHVTLRLQHHDPASLLAGKLHAVLARPYVKGRDLYDLVWYLSDRAWPAPNLEFLNNALRQTGWRGPVITAENWRATVADTVAGADWRRVLPDVRPFLERDRDADLLTKENLLALLVKTVR